MDGNGAENCTYPAALRGDSAMASAVSLINRSLKQFRLVLSLQLMAHRYLCHEHHPRGGVSAAPLSSADAN